MTQIVDQLAEIVGGRVVGDGATVIERIADLIGALRMHERQDEIDISRVEGLAGGGYYGTVERIAMRRHRPSPWQIRASDRRRHAPAK